MSGRVVQRLAAPAVLLLVLAAHQAGAQQLTPAERQQVLDAHNQLRCTVDPTAHSMPALTWDPLLEQVAQEWIDTCPSPPTHNSNRSTRYAELGGSGYVGENMAWGHATLNDAMAAWGAERAGYDYASDACTAATCGHYTQMVWARTLRVGCARAPSACARSYVCNYAPGGNLGGRPYSAGPGSNESCAALPPDQAPVAVITEPAAGSLYAAGEALAFAGSASDPEDGTLPANAFTWRVDFHHDAHTHPLLGPTTGVTSGSVAIPAAGHTDVSVFYRVHLSVRDSAGNTHAVQQDVLPRTASVRLATEPPGLALRLDGQPAPAPIVFLGVAGVPREVEAPSPQLVDGTTWAFDAWADGGARARTITTPLVDTVWTATFRRARAAILSQAPGSVLPAPEATFAWTSGTGVLEYALSVGTTPGGAEIHAGAPVSALSEVVSGLPADGRTLHVRLRSRFATGWEHEDYEYRAALPARSEPVAWTRLSGVQAVDSDLVMTGPRGWGNAGAVSTKALLGDGAVELTASETTSARMWGLSHDDFDQGWRSLDFALYLSPTAGLAIYESGVYRGAAGAYARGDVLRIEVAAGVVRYFSGGALLYESAVPPPALLRVDTSLYTPGATLTGSVLHGSWGTPPEPKLLGTPVAWTGAVGVAARGTGLAKTASTGWGNAGASSLARLGAGSGYVEFRASEGTSSRMLGLGGADLDQGWSGLDHAFYLRSDQRLQVYERGVYRGYFGTYFPGDVLRVGVEGGVVVYRRNGVRLFASPTPPAYPLLVDTSFYSWGATLLDVVVSGSWAH
jgi:hypothetical protein